MTHVPTLVSAGPHAVRALVPGATGEVTAVFAQSFHVELDGRIACIGGPALGNGPLNALCLAMPPAGWRGTGIAEGARCRVEGGSLRIDAGPPFDLAGVSLWSPPPWPTGWRAENVRRALGILAALAGPQLPRDGLACVAFGSVELRGLTGAMQRVALLRTATLSDWLADVLAAPTGERDPALAAAANAAVNGLLGLGPGLTPSGDDLIAGLLVALHAAGARDAADALSGHVRAAPSDRTSRLSRAFLAAAMDGLGGEAIVAIVAALLLGDAAVLRDRLAAIDAIGHTSGWDTLAGAVLGLAAVAAAQLGRALE